MKNELNEKTNSPFLITISEIPSKIKIDDLEIIKNQCQLNSKKISDKYPDVEYIEGILIIIDKDDAAKALAHAWNRIENIHFDITEKNWIGEHFNEIVKTCYLSVKSYFGNELNEKIEFSRETIRFVKELNDKFIDNLNKDVPASDSSDIH